MEIKLTEYDLNKIKRFLEDILVEKRQGKELIDGGIYVTHGCETLARANHKFSGAISVLVYMGIKVDINEYDEVTLRKER